MQHLKFPIGPFEKKEKYSRDELVSICGVLDEAPTNYRNLVAKLNPVELTKTYLEGSWTIRQLVHHVADIQLLHFLRMKKAITEPAPGDLTIIDMDAWAGTLDVIDGPIDDSLIMFEGTSRRYAILIRSLDDDALKIQYFHPIRKFSVDHAQAAAMSAWHVQHHLAHIKLALGIAVGLS